MNNDNSLLSFYESVQRMNHVSDIKEILYI